MDNQNKTMIAQDVMVPRKEVLTCAMRDRLHPILQKMDEKNFTHVIVLDRDRVCGILSEKTMLTIAANEGNYAILDRNVDEIANYVSLQQVCLEHFFEYITPKTSIAAIKELFVKIEKDKERLDLLIVTENGKVTGDFLGIITPWEVM